MNEQEKQKYYSNEAFETIYEKAKRDNAPELASFTPLDEQTLAERIGAALRPLYERAIASVFRGNRRANAELDADALSRGMGSSTFGTDLIVRIFSVTSSPTKPSPRVDALVNSPCSYSIATDRPSIFGSTTNSGSSTFFLTVSIKLLTSS